MPEPTSKRTRSFATPEKFSDWLAKNHASEPELWLKIHKKASGRKSINWEEAVIEALCWGWIDGIKKKFDDDSFLQRFTPRRPGSNWSKRNRENVERLILEKRMTKFGMVHVEAAKSDGRWEMAYAPSSEMEIPDDLLAAVNSNARVKKFFASLSRTNLYAITYRLHTAKTPKTRQRRFDKILEMLKNGETFH
ncbi:MAG: YdeI/OmpD-associated family protein [Pirellulaceae bacterium]